MVLVLAVALTLLFNVVYSHIFWVIYRLRLRIQWFGHSNSHVLQNRKRSENNYGYSLTVWYWPPSRRKIRVFSEPSFGLRSSNNISETNVSLPHVFCGSRYTDPKFQRISFFLLSSDEDNLHRYCKSSEESNFVLTTNLYPEIGVGGLLYKIAGLLSFFNQSKFSANVTNIFWRVFVACS